MKTKAEARVEVRNLYAVHRGIRGTVDVVKNLDSLHAHSLEPVVVVPAHSEDQHCSL